VTNTPTGTFAPIREVAPLQEGVSVRRVRPWLALLSIIAIASFSLEVEILEHLDSFSRFMNYREILFDSGVSLLGTICAGLAWWLTVLLFLRMVGLVAGVKRHAAALAWSLWLGVPATYLALDLFRAVEIQFSSAWVPRFSSWLMLGAILGIACIVGVFSTDQPRLQRFCRSRLAPVGGLLSLLGVVMLIALFAKGVHPFHNYVNPAKTVEASDLPDIYLITMDALRTDDMSVYGYNRPTTPNLEHFAQRSSTFDYFVANSNFTTPATTSIETGKLPWSHRIFHLWGFLHQANAENMGAVLRQRGYYTAMISSNSLASPLQHRTLDSYDAVNYPKPLGAYGWWRHTFLVDANGLSPQSALSVSIVGHLAILGCYLDMLITGDRYPFPAEEVFDGARTIAEERKGKQPLFMWTHILPPHDPYWPPAAFRRRFLPLEKLKSYDVAPTNLDVHKLPPATSAAQQRARYDEMVLYADHAVGDFLDWLERTGRMDRSIVIISADHGESFEHDWFNHMGPYLYNGLIHIPLLIHLPGQKQGDRVSFLAQQADLLPTILDLVGSPTPKWTDGISLKTVLQGNQLSKRYIFTMNLEPNRVFDPITKGTVAVMDDEFKYVNYLQLHKGSLYRYKSDALEEQDLINSEPEVAGRMRNVLMNKLSEVNGPYTSKTQNPGSQLSIAK
jgi:arylsulfatase A-like enzyme